MEVSWVRFFIIRKASPVSHLSHIWALSLPAAPWRAFSSLLQIATETQTGVIQSSGAKKSAAPFFASTDLMILGNLKWKDCLGLSHAVDQVQLSAYSCLNKCRPRLQASLTPLCILSLTVFFTFHFISPSQTTFIHYEELLQNSKRDGNWAATSWRESLYAAIHRSLSLQHWRKNGHWNRIRRIQSLFLESCFT